MLYLNHVRLKAKAAENQGVILLAKFCIHQYGVFFLHTILLCPVFAIMAGYLFHTFLDTRIIVLVIAVRAICFSIS